MASGTTVWKNWAELLAIGLLVIGFLIAVSLDSAIFIYIIVFIAGLFAGRYYFLKVGKQLLFPFFMIIMGFLIGFTIGSFAANRIIVLILFIFAWIISHKAHKEGLIPQIH